MNAQCSLYAILTQSYNVQGASVNLMKGVAKQAGFPFYSHVDIKGGKVMRLQLQTDLCRRFNRAACLGHHGNTSIH